MELCVFFYCCYLQITQFSLGNFSPKMNWLKEVTGCKTNNKKKNELNGKLPVSVNL